MACIQLRLIVYIYLILPLRLISDYTMFQTLFTFKLECKCMVKKICKREEKTTNLSFFYWLILTACQPVKKLGNRVHIYNF